MSAQACPELDLYEHSEGDQAVQCFQSLHSSSDDLDWMMHTQFLESDVLLHCPLPSPFPVNESKDENAYDTGAFDIFAGYVSGTDILIERLDVSKDTAEFLAHNVLLPANIRGDVDTSSPISHLRSMKLQEPVLRTDHELELLDVKRRNMTKPSNVGSTFDLHDEEDESLSWPSGTSALAAAAEAIVRTEKLSIDKHTVLLLQDVVGEGNVKAEDDIHWAYIKLSNISNQMSPPILPFSPPSTSAYVPDMNLDFTSTPEDPDVAQLETLEHDLMHEHLSSPGNLVQRTSESSFKRHEMLSLHPSSTTPHRKRVRDFKIDTPPLPLALSSDTHSEKRAKLQAPGLGLDFDLPHAASDSSFTNTQEVESELEQLLEHVVMPGAVAAAEQLQHEQLSKVDTLMRIQVPKVESISPIPPWEVFLLNTTGQTSLAAQRTWLKYTKHELLQSEQKWRGATRLERSLPWSPFSSSLATVDLHETLGDVPLSEYLDNMSLRKDHMRDSPPLESRFHNLLRGWPNSADEIQQLHYVTAAGEHIASLEHRQSNTTSDNTMTLDARPSVASARPTSVRPPYPAHQTTSLETLLRLKRAQVDGSTYSRASALLPYDNHLGSNTQASVHTADLSGFMHRLGDQVHKPATASQQPSILAHNFDVSQVCPSQHPDESKNKKQQQIPPNPLSPKLDAHRTKVFCVIMSSLMLADRAFAKALQNLLPNTLFMEREFPVLGPENGRGNDARRTVPKPTIDMIIAPGTGIIVTSLQQLKQKALPGHTMTFGVRERVAVAIQSVKRLLVMIRDTSQRLDGTSTATLDQCDCDELTDLISTTAILDADVHVVVIPGGADALARWTASAVVHYSEDSDGELLPEETTWERLLCAAGIDAFTAQLILKSLKRPRATPSGSDASDEYNQGIVTDGLPALVKMAATQRMKRFAPFLEGAAVLPRFNDTIDMRWTSRPSTIEI